MFPHRLSLRIFALSAFVLVAASLGLAADNAAKVLNPWKQLPAGTTFEFTVSTDIAAGLHQKVTHSEVKEVWTVISNNGLLADIDVTIGDGRKHLGRDLTPVNPLPRPSSKDDRPGRDHTTVSSDQIETPFGTFAAVRIDYRQPMFESERHGSEWSVLGFPEPVKSVSVHSSDIGTLYTTTETRRLTRFDVPGSAWSDFTVGTIFEIQVEKENRQLFPKGQKPTLESSVERWKLIEKKQDQAVFEVSTGTAVAHDILPIAMYPPPAAGSTLATNGMEIRTETARELVSTPLGSFYATRIRNRRVMNEAGGEDNEWRVAGYPLPLKSQNRSIHKQQEDTETRTLIRFEGVPEKSK
jgi:hypothetical protein